VRTLVKPLPNYDLIQTFGTVLFIIICIGIAFVWLKIRKPHLRIGLTIIIMISAYLFSLSDISKHYGISVTQRDLISLVILSLSFLTLFYNSQKKIRLYFVTSTKKQALHKQRQKCGICGKGLAKFNIDFDHKNGNRSDNRLSNCRALCTPCHRKKHTER
jgi:membrane-bound ClpP family serine protease